MTAFAGFDTDIYPGDNTLSWLKSNTNLVWCGYYLAPVPCHGDKSWMGKRNFLTNLGWGILPVFVGRQVVGHSPTPPDGPTGITDGQHAAQLMAADGFAPGSYVFLDLENGPPFTPAQHDYVAAWYDTVTQAGFGAGIYCSYLLAQTVAALRPARIWTFHVKTIAAHSVAAPFSEQPPSGSGFLPAVAWQLEQNAQIQAGSTHPLTVDLSTATTPSPTAP